MNRGTLKGFADKVERILPIYERWIWSGSGTYHFDPRTTRYTAELQAPGGGGSGRFNSGNTYPGMGGGAGGRTLADMSVLGPVDFFVGVPGGGGPDLLISGGTDGGDVVFGVLAAEGGKGARNGLPGAGGRGIGADGIDGGSGGISQLDSGHFDGTGGKRPGGAGTETNGGLQSGINKSGGGGGGSSPYGRGGKGANAGAANQKGGDGEGYGSGGGGGANNGDGRGGDGGRGFIHIKEYAE